MSPGTDAPDRAGSPQVDAGQVAEMLEQVIRDLGPDIVSQDDGQITRMSVDWAHMSPILQARLPAGRADAVISPTNAEQIPLVLAAAYAHGIPVTARGTGLGNYGQSIPLHGGVVLDVSRCRAVLEVGPGRITVEAGARMRDIDAVARSNGQELTIYPSTKGSTLGGFLAGGSGGTGSIRFGANSDGFVLELDVAACDGSGEYLHVAGDETLPFVHAYGTTGVIGRATVTLTPARPWAGMYTAWDDYTAAVTAMRRLRDLDPVPRLISLDEAEIVAVLPADPALDPQRISMRAILEEGVVDEATAVVESLGGSVLAVRRDVNGADRLTSLSFNHSTFHLQKKRPGYFHLEVAGELLRSAPDRVRAVFPGTVLHLEESADGVGGMLMARYESPEQVYAGMDALTAIGIGIHSPHTWLLSRRIDEVRAVAQRMDPHGLLNPGKLLTPA